MSDTGYPGVTYRAVAAKAEVTPGLGPVLLPDPRRPVPRRHPQPVQAEPRAARRGPPNERRPAAAGPLEVQPGRVDRRLSPPSSWHSATTTSPSRSEIAQATEQVRRLQLDALETTFGTKDIAIGDLSQSALLFVLTGIPKLLRLEKGVGISTAHAEVLEAFEQFLDSAEPSPRAPRHVARAKPSKKKPAAKASKQQPA